MSSNKSFGKINHVRFSNLIETTKQSIASSRFAVKTNGSRVVSIVISQPAAKSVNKEDKTFASSDVNRKERNLALRNFGIGTSITYSKIKLSFDNIKSLALEPEQNSHSDHHVMAQVRKTEESGEEASKKLSFEEADTTSDVAGRETPGVKRRTLREASVECLTDPPMYNHEASVRFEN